MSRVAMGSDGGSWAMDPATALTTSFGPQGIGPDLTATIEGFSPRDFHAVPLAANPRRPRAHARGRPRAQPLFFGHRRRQHDQR